MGKLKIKFLRFIGNSWAKNKAFHIYRSMVADELFKRLGNIRPRLRWSADQCFDYSGEFHGYFEDRWDDGNFNDIGFDVEDDISYWEQ